MPAGYVADRIARQNLTAPAGVLPAPWLGPDVLLLADAARWTAKYWGKRRARFR